MRTGLNSLNRIWMAAAAVMLLTAAPALAARSVNESVDVGRNARIKVENIAGSITVMGGSGSVVEIGGTIGDDVEELRVNQRGGTLMISVELPEGDNDRDMELSADLEIRVPSGSALEIEAISASVKVDNVQGGLSIEAISGKVELNGDLGAIQVETVSGNVQVNAGSLLQEASFESVSGNITSAADLSDSGEFAFETVSGDVTVEVPSGFSADWKVESFSGAIDNGIGPKAERTSKYAPGKELNFSSGGGGADVSIETLSGKVTIR